MDEQRQINVKADWETRLKSFAAIGILKWAKFVLITISLTISYNASERAPHSHSTEDARHSATKGKNRNEVEQGEGAEDFAFNWNTLIHSSWISDVTQDENEFAIYSYKWGHNSINRTIGNRWASPVRRTNWDRERESLISLKGRGQRKRAKE